MSGPIHSPNALSRYAGSSLLSRGSRGVEVVAMQRKLGVKADGIFGPRTESALRTYQRQHGLKADGIFGAKSRGHLFSRTTGQSSMMGGFGGTSSLLRRGSRGAEVAAMQRKLGVKADGIFGHRTETALKTYQRQHGLKADGIFGAKSRGQLFSRTTGQSPKMGGFGGASSLLRRGSRGAEVAAMQRKLGVKADGIFGSRTETALKTYQRQHGLKADGIFGARSRGQLFRGTTPTISQVPVSRGTGRRSRINLTSGSAFPNLKFSVPTIAHTGGEDLCFWDSISMVAQHKQYAQMLKSPFHGATQPWDALLKTGRQRWITNRGRGIFHVGEKTSTVLKSAQKLGFQAAYINATPQEFQQSLKKHGPFVYFGRLKEKGLQGQNQNHSVVVTGIESQGGNYYVSYNDPRTKRPQRNEFYGFLLKYMPYLKDASHGNKNMVLHLSQGL